jgi:hypothetical protein
MKNKLRLFTTVSFLAICLSSVAQAPQTSTLNSTNIKGSATVDSLLIAKDTIVAKRDVRIVGELKVKGEAKFKDKLTVDGITKLNGGLKLSNFAGVGENLVYVDANGNFKINPVGSGNTPVAACLQGAKPWYVGGNINGANSVAGTCDNFDFILQANSTQRVWIKPDGTISFGANIPSNTNGAEYKFHQGVVRLSGSNTFGPGPGLIFDGGVNPYGDWGLEYNASALTKPGLNFWKPFGSQYSNNNILFLADDGTIGIGTDNPNSRLTVDSWNSDGIVNITSNLSSKALSLKSNVVLNNPIENFVVYGDGKTTITTANIDAFAIRDATNQNVTNFKVKRNGEVFARHIKVMVANFPDYVFEADYKIMSLLEVEKYYKQYKHLPEIPSAKEVEENDLDIGEMNKLLLKKIEELTIHMVQQQKEIDELKKQIKK